MRFVDHALIYVKSGNGGRGCVSFRREKYVPKGGPDGGDGGRGGHVILATSSQKDTLYRFHLNQHFRAKNGRHGRGQNKHGADGADLTIELPPGTLVYDAETDEWLFDLITPGQSYVAIEGGRGGRGNARFASSTNRAPRQSGPGEPGQERRLRLELKLLADVGLVGLPNTGKSTLISKLSAARPKIAAYPFTTLIPNLGLVSLDEERSFVVADIPGLIKGSSQGAGLGHRFLRHVQRCRVLVHLLDAGRVRSAAPLEDWETELAELTAFDPSLLEKKQLVAVNKMDLPGAAQALALVRSALPDQPVLGLSALSGQGLKELKLALWRLLDQDEPGSEEALW
ncbi:MAG: GTPase ObgE [Pseudomonadota bacterium]